MQISTNMKQLTYKLTSHEDDLLMILWRGSDRSGSLTLTNMVWYRKFVSTRMTLDDSWGRMLISLWPGTILPSIIPALILSLSFGPFTCTRRVCLVFASVDAAALRKRLIFSSNVTNVRVTDSFLVAVKSEFVFLNFFFRCKDMLRRCCKGWLASLSLSSCAYDKRAFVTTKNDNERWGAY